MNTFEHVVKRTTQISLDMHDCITSNIFEDGSNLAFLLMCTSLEGKY